jgi:hypothetical protein
MPICKTLSYVLIKPQNNANRSIQQTKFIKVHNTKFRTPPLYIKICMKKYVNLKLQAKWGGRLTHWLCQHFTLLFNRQHIWLLNNLTKTNCWRSQRCFITNNFHALIPCISKHVKGNYKCFTWFHNMLLLPLPYQSSNTLYKRLNSAKTKNNQQVNKKIPTKFFMN